MDLSTIIGIVAGFALIVWGIKFQNLGNFWDPQSLALTLGGTVAAVIASFPFNQLKKMGSHFKILLQGNRYNYGALIDQMVELAQLARQNGLLSLEEKANEIEDPFFKGGLMLVVDATDEDEIRARMQNELDSMAERHDAGVAIYEKASGYAPAFGMIGTLVGLVNMLYNMDDVANLGPAMAVALITTLYGSLLANWICTPVSNKLKADNGEEVVLKEVMIEGLLSIQAGENPRVIEEKLKSFLAPKDRTISEEGAGGDE